MSAPVLITGANGQVGFELARQAEQSQVPFVAFTRDDLDISDGAQVDAAMAQHAPSVVVNAAAYTAVDKAEDDEQTAFAANRDGAANLAQACAKADIPLIHISTDYVFDGSKQGAYLETDSTAPLGVYGVSKLAGEEAVRAAGSKHVILRTAWVYGNHGHNFVKTMLRLGRERDELSVVDDQRGCPTYAADLAAVILSIQNMLTGSSASVSFGTFHCTNSGETTWCGFADAVFDHLDDREGRRPLLTPIATKDYPTPAKRPKNSVLNNDQIQTAFGISMRPWQAALSDMLDRELGDAKR